MTRKSDITSVDILACDAGWRNYHFVKVMTEDGVVGWSEYDEGFGSPGVSAAIQRLAARVVGQNAFHHERIYAELFAAPAPPLAVWSHRRLARSKMRCSTPRPST